MAAPKNMSAEQRRQRAAKAGAASHAAESLADRLAAQWPNLSEERRREVIETLRPIANTERGSDEP